VLLVLGARAATPCDEFGLTGLGGLSFLVAFLAFATIGAPGNPIGALPVAGSSGRSTGAFIGVSTRPSAH